MKCYKYSTNGKVKYFMISDKWYVIFSKTWLTSQNFANSNTSTLTTITPEETQKAIASLTDASRYLYLTNILKHGHKMESIREWS